MDYKHEVENRIQGNPGTSPLEVLCVGFNSIVIIALLSQLKPFPASQSTKIFMFHIITITAGYVIIYSGVGLIVTTIISACLWLFFGVRRYTSTHHKNNIESHTRSVITYYRSTLMLSTCYCILAVDFPPLFPKEYIKTETYGISVMDLGVGCFVFSAGYVAWNKRAWKLLSAIPLVALGCVRIFMVKGITDYQEHVAEYGVYWNFFFTLAAMPMLTAIPLFSNF
eukprot:PhF_6_TR27807/c0_g1_i2/m.40544/K05283/PIGW; phosphatidylinositol glycan, class W